MKTLPSLSLFLREITALAGRARLASAFALIVAAGIIDMAALSLLVPLLDTLSSGGRAVIGPFARFAAGLLDRLSLPLTLQTIAGLFVVIAVVRAMTWRARDMLMIGIRIKFVSGLRLRLYRAIAAADWPYLQRSRMSDLQSALLSEIERINQGCFFATTFPARAVIALANIGVALSLSPLFSALALAIGLILAWMMRGRVRDSIGLGRALHAANRAQHGEATGFLSGLKLAKSHGLETRHVSAFATAMAEIDAKTQDFARSSANARVFQEIGGAVLMMAFIAWGAAWLDLGASETLVLILVSYRLLPQARDIQQAIQQTAHMLPTFAAFMETCRQCEAVGQPLPAPHMAPLAVTRSIRLEGVRFAHPEGPEILRDIDLSLPLGSLTVLCGESGIGKSTILDLLVGLLAPTSGRVLLDDQPLAPVLLPRWRQSIAYVPQDAYFFHDTIRANLAWIAPDADDGRMAEALTLAAADFVLGWPDGLATVVGERGTRLSGGERQRLAVARALLRHPTLLVLDEPTAALDENNERQILHTLERLHGRMTTILVTHRPSVVTGADQVFTLRDGRLYPLIRSET